jgi:uncharacterized protein (DUF2164 family)
MVVKLPKEQKDMIIQHIQTYFLNERGEEIGELAAGNFLDFFMKELEPYFYNNAVEEVRTLVEQRMAGIEEDIYAMKRPIHLHRRK